MEDKFSDKRKRTVAAILRIREEEAHKVKVKGQQKRKPNIRPNRDFRDE